MTSLVKSEYILQKNIVKNNILIFFILNEYILVYCLKTVQKDFKDCSLYSSNEEVNIQGGKGMEAGKESRSGKNKALSN
jgi:hypothetical protein